MAVDLHIHSTASDGSCTPAAVVELAIAKGLSALAIADHDTVSGVVPGQRAAAGRIGFLPAVEISTHHGQHELHLLGYMLDIEHPTLVAELAHIQEERIKRAQNTVAALQSLGVEVDYEDVEAVASGASLGRPHVATALVNRGVVATPAEAFTRYLRRGRPAYVDRYRLSPVKAIALIRQAGGLPVLAHPKLVHRDSLFPELVGVGLGGVEVYHSQHSRYDVERYRALAERYHLLVTGGTDSHGPGGTAPVEIGAVEVPDECAERLVAWKSRQDPPPAAVREP